MFEIPTLYTSYEELLLDLSIYGKVLCESNISYEVLKDLLFEEYKMSHPLPTLEDERYKLSSLVSSNYHIQYTNSVSLLDNEELVDLRSEGIDNSIEREMIVVPEELRSKFTYSCGITESLRDQIIREYMKNDEIEMFDDEKEVEFDPVGEGGIYEETDNYRGSDDVSYTDEEDDTEGYDDNYDTDEEDTDGFEDDPYGDNSDEVYNYDDEGWGSGSLEDDESVDDYDSYESEGETGVDEMEEGVYTVSMESYDDEEEEGEDEGEEYDPYSDDDEGDEGYDPYSDDEEGDEYDPYSDYEEDDEYDSYSDDDGEDEDESYISYSGDNEDEETLNEGTEEDNDEDSEEEYIYYTVEEDEESESGYGSYEEEESENDYESYDEESEDVKEFDSYDEDSYEKDFTDEDEPESIQEFSSHEEDFVVNEASSDTSEVVEHGIDSNEEYTRSGSSEGYVSDNTESKPVFCTPDMKVNRSEEPSDLRQFVRLHPRCEISFALQYFSQKEIQKYLRLGKIFKKGNKLHI